MKTRYIAYPSPPPFSKFFHPPFPVMSNPHPHCSFCCLVSLAEWVIALHLMCYFTERYHRCTHVKPYDLDACFMQQGLKFTEVWHRMWFFTGTLIWSPSHTQTQTHTQRHTAHSGFSRWTHPYKHIFTPTVMCS